MARAAHRAADGRRGREVPHVRLELPGGHEAAPLTTPGAGVTPALLLVAAIWGGSYSAIKAAQRVVPPLPLAAFRCGGAALVLGAGLLLTRVHPALTRREWRRVVGLGLVGNTIFQLCMVGGLAFTTPAHAALLVAFSPVFAALLARIWHGEPLGVSRVTGILLSLAGVALIVMRDGNPGSASLGGDLLSLGAALAWAVYSVAGKPLLATRPSFEVTALAMLVGTVGILPIGLPGLLVVPWARLSWETWAVLLYLSMLALAFNYVLWYWALARTSTARAVAFTYLTPVLASALAIALGQQEPTVSLLLGAPAVIGGVVLAQRSATAGRRSPAE